MSDDVDKIYGAALLALLKGREPARFAGDDTRPEELLARAADGDGDARQLLRAQRALGELPARVRLAVARDQAPVVVADGSSFTLDEAERLLERKEEHRAHRALRESVDDAGAKFRHFHERRTDATPAPSGADPLAGFLAATVGLRDAAREALATLGGEPLEDPPALARALDLPDAEGSFGDASTTGLLAAGRDACRPPRKVGRFAAPRSMAGAVVDDGELRFAQPPRLARFDRHMRTLEAGAAALAKSHEKPTELGLAMALGLTGAVVRRAGGASKSAAERAARIAAAAGVLTTRAHVALAVLDVDTRNTPDGVREALAKAFGTDPGHVLTLEMTQPPWSLDVDDATRAHAALKSAQLALALRDAYDETYPLHSAAWVEVPDVDDKSPGWAQWAGELL